jgi:hypothetical protein
MRTLILNNTNVVPNTNNSIFRYNFPAGNVSFKKGQKLAVSSISMYYSTFNITSALNNNKFNYIWVDNTLVSITIPDGFYDINSLNAYLKFCMAQQGHYLTDANGNYVYFLSFVVNASTYQIAINSYPLSLALYPDASYNYGSATTGTINNMTPTTFVQWSKPQSQAICPTIQILNNNFTKIIGFQAGYFPQGQTGFATTPPTVSLAQATISVVPNLTFSIASSTGTTITTSGSPSLVVGMIIQTTGSLLFQQGTIIVSGSVNTWVVSKAPITTIISTTACNGYSTTNTQSPVYTSVQTLSSSSTPQVSPLSSYVITCDLLNNNYAIPNTLLYSFAPIGSIGSQFTVAPNQLSFIDIQDGQYTSFQVQFLDQNLYPVTLQDNNLVILLIITDATGDNTSTF